MSKLIVDDIELASGDNFSIPNEIQQDKLIKVSGGNITEFEDLPTSGEYKLIHDFADGQPESITHTLSKSSDQLIGFHLIFEGMRFDSAFNLDIGWDVYTAAGDTHANYFANYKYNSVAQYNNTTNGSDTNGGAQYMDQEVHMAPHRNQWGIGYDDYSNTWRNIGTYDHYCFFYENASGAHMWRAMGNYNCTSNASVYEVAWNRIPAQSITYDHNGLAQASYWPSEPYTKIILNTRGSEGFNVHQGKIKIMEMVL